jgi:triosephosphate isomerase
MIVAANFKTNKTRIETINYLKELKTIDFGSVKVAIFPPQSALIEDELIGAQNAYPTINGAYTGEIGLEQLNEFNIKRILIGHSERRHILGENQEFVAEKFRFFKENGFEIFYCIGEPLEIRKKGIDFGSVKVAIFPPQSALIEDELIGAQNAYPTINGAYTGEIGLEQLNEFNIKRILIGHSERRHILGESQEFIGKKFKFFKDNGFEIFYCIIIPAARSSSMASKSCSSSISVRARNVSKSKRTPIMAA